MSSTDLRKSTLGAARNVVIKLGTQLLSGDDDALDLRYLRDLARQVRSLRDAGRTVTLVVSGAIGEGCRALALKQRPRDVAALQAAAAVGQPRLMRHLHDAFSRQGLTVAQLLLTRGDFDDRIRFLNIRNCVVELHEAGCVPVINENDTVAVDEIEALRLGENDILAAMICNALRADALVLLSVVDGLQDNRGRRIDRVDAIDDAAHYVQAHRSALGKGGMKTKLEAAGIATAAGEVTVIAHGRDRNILPRLFAGEAVGTIFAPVPRKLDSRRRWIGMTRRPTGKIVVDHGAAEALRRRGKSLLAIGIVAVHGRFRRGEVVRACDPDGAEVGRGLTNYSHTELAKIQGCRSSQFARLLGHPGHAEVIHRDNFVLFSH